MKSDHLGIADLEDLIEENKSLVFTIKEVKQEINVAVAGKKGSFNIAYFVEKIKPLVLNSTNCKQVKAFCKNSPFVEDWKNVLVELYIDSSVKMKGQVVGGVRVKQTSPTVSAPISDVNAIKILRESKTLEDLKANWEKLSASEKNLPTVLSEKETLKTTLK